MSKYRWILLAAAFLLVGCSTQKAEATATPPALEENWSVKMTLSGGIAWLLRTVEVQADGSYTVVDERAGTTIQGSLDNEKLTALKALIENLVITTPKNPGVCADCFVYDIEIQNGGKRMIANVDDLSVGESGMGELVNFLQELINTALK